jgi:hypothetical protein
MNFLSHNKASAITFLPDSQAVLKALCFTVLSGSKTRFLKQGHSNHLFAKCQEVILDALSFAVHKTRPLQLPFCQMP